MLERIDPDELKFLSNDNESLTRLLSKDNELKFLSNDNEAIQVFDKAIYAVEDSRVGVVKEMAKRFIDKIRSKELLVLASNATFKIPAVTGFDLVEFPSSSRFQYIPAVIIDIDKLVNSDPERVVGDLVRTVGVVDQFPDKGYQRRLISVYKQAIELQEQWLKEQSSPNIEFDPRKEDVELLIKSLIGEARYYSDTGFDDWQQSIRDFRKIDQDPSISRMLNQLEGALGHFLVMRQRFTPMIYQTATQTVGRAYINKWNSEKRAEAAACNFLGSSLYARKLEN